jgi:hypothetical protein
MTHARIAPQLGSAMGTTGSDSTTRWPISTDMSRFHLLENTTEHIERRLLEHADAPYIHR